MDSVKTEISVKLITGLLEKVACKMLRTWRCLLPYPQIAEATVTTLCKERSGGDEQDGMMGLYGAARASSHGSQDCLERHRNATRITKRSISDFDWHEAGKKTHPRLHGGRKVFVRQRTQARKKQATKRLYML